MSQTIPFVYTDESTREISFPLGGIGTGSIGLSGAGRFIDWEILNRPSKGSTNGLSHFAIRAEQDGKTLDARLLHGPYRGSLMGDITPDWGRNFGTGARRFSLVGAPHFAECRFEGRYPTARLSFADDRFPGNVAMTAFNPFLPLDDLTSSMPVAMFEFEVANPTAAPIAYSIVGVLGHLPTAPTGAERGEKSVRVFTTSAGADAPDYGELVLATDAAATSGQTHLYRGLWFDSFEVYWDDLRRPGKFAERRYYSSLPTGGMSRDGDSSLQAAHITVAPGEIGRARFVIAWYVPNFHKFWVSKVWHFRQPSPAEGVWKNWYATQWKGAAEIAAIALKDWDRLAEGTQIFRDALYGSSLPHAVIDAAAANLSILRTPTTVRLTDGTFYAFEGLNPGEGSCEGSCTHVWNYAQALPFLFPALERSMREADYRNNMDAAGGMSFRMSLPIGSGLSTERPCADGQFGNAMKAYRDWKLCGDDAWLRRLWPLIRKSIEYAWHPGNPDRWDPERTGVLTGRQHHTLDMELFGANSWLTGFYVGALSAGAEMADAMGDPDTARQWRDMAQRGRRYMADKLFKGSYFVQEVELNDRSVLDAYAEATKSRRLMGGDVYDQYWSEEHGELKCQLGDGVLIDQVLPGWHARLYGLPDIYDPQQFRSALSAIWQHNFKLRLGDLFNPCRVYGVYDESGTVIIGFPAGVHKPAIPAPYAQETFHGMEYAFGAALMQEGMLREGVRAFKAVRDRYAGSNRNPWNEMEAGSNYARSMASWSGVLTLSGFSFDARRQHIGFAPMLRDGLAFRCIWSNGLAWGTVTLEEGSCALRVLGGQSPLASLGLPLPKAARATVTLNDAAVTARVEDGTLRFAAQTLRGGDVLRVAAAGMGVAALPDATQM
ncbi:MAG: hypothetical protein HYR63_29025 [Proteobacteria bacterium]|nr:hypothetical protein [Pseudomonadota bacterium]MBI3495765.1 hypothetical protein [Pseudomonadota bacterium]